VFGRLWQELRLKESLEERLKGKKFSFPVERVVFGSVLYWLFEAGSEHQCHRFLRDACVPGGEETQLQHLYRAMRFLGEEKEKIEERLFFRNRDLFSQLKLVFFDTTSFYFHGEVGELEKRDYSRDRRPARLPEVALANKGLLEVERFFRAAKDLLETRPIFHKFAATICGHIFVSFLALVLVHKLKARLKRKGVEAEWKDLVRDLLGVREVEVLHGGWRYLLQSPLKGVAVPPPARKDRGAKTDVQAL